MQNDEYGSQQTPDSIFIFYMITMLDSLMLVAPNPETTHSCGLGIGFPFDWFCFYTSKKKKINPVLQLGSDF